MHSKALVETHLVSNVPESLDILRLHHEIGGNAGTENKCADEGEVSEMCKVMLHIKGTPPIAH